MESDPGEAIEESQDNAATNMVPTAQPGAPTLTQIVTHNEPDYRMFRELAVVEL